MEKWRPVEGYYGYEVSDLGNIRCFIRGDVRPVTLHANSVTGYVICHLHSPGLKRITKNLHSLVAKAFIENPNNYDSIDHKNSNKWDNSVANLRYMPHKNNCQRYSSRPIELQNVQTGEKKIFLNSKEAGNYLGVHYNSVRSAAATLKTKNRRRVCKGHYAKYVDMLATDFVDKPYEEIILKQDIDQE